MQAVFAYVESIEFCSPVNAFGSYVINFFILDFILHLLRVFKIPSKIKMFRRWNFLSHHV